MGDEEYTLRSSARMFREFIEGPIWGDMKNELAIWLDGARDGLEDTEADEKEIYRNQGRADAIRRVMTLPEVMKDDLELEKQRSESGDDSNTEGLEEMLNE